MQKLLLTLLCVAYASANELTDAVDFDPRFLFNNTNDGAALTTTAVLTAIGGLVALVLLGLLIWLAVSLVLPADDFGTGFTSTGFTGATGFQARSGSDPYSAIWDNLSVLDWIAMMEEVYRKFDANKMECQQRVVCELHQNENTWGSTARKMNDAFGYLQYLELLNLPADLRVVLDQYLEAANRGRSSQKSCEELYANCEFSVKALISKYNGSNSI
ncbi:uncharacterized protein LOC122385256 isoform X4 [Amphibalanus amphitrite]|uniref:uncharacterized protein LOC122384856 isoform X3 n=1 Tax=Amphibalanus amphitrite TaxID=1232801 RepID=UPI001C923BD6|nr:uncharacterized protein LOC122384856 isoform X3 [Amphibalanus amphitrite]XP_043229333.1 uncharacterized protein LOC122385256 isoform X4 [Amphibalanus amphitrite]